MISKIYIPNKSAADPGSSLGGEPFRRSAVPAAVVGSNQVGALLTVQSPMTLPTEILEAPIFGVGKKPNGFLRMSFFFLKTHPKTKPMVTRVEKELGLLT